MGIEAISGVNSHMSSAVSGIMSIGSNVLPDDIVKKLKELGIDPTTVKSVSEARTLIAQAEQTKRNKQTSQVQPQQSSPNIDMKQLNDDIKTLGDKLGINTDLIKDRQELLDKLDAGVKEFVQSASAQSNMSDISVKMKNGTEAKGNSQQMQADFNSIKDRIEELENAKTSMFAGQDMLAQMNRMALGI